MARAPPTPVLDFCSPDTHCGVDVSAAVAFGDGPNDLDMLLAVPHSYAMANAEPQVKEASAHIVPWTNAEGGVARMLEQLV